jgi:hypothetical protein
MDHLNSSDFWAAVFWGGVAGGYLVYGWRQKSAIPLAGGAAMTAVSFLLPALWMSAASIGIMIAVWRLRE